MRRDEVEEGAALDVMVAEKVMGWKRWSCVNNADGSYSDSACCRGFADERGKVRFYTFKAVIYPNDPAWSPSREISAAFEVVEKMKELGHGIEVCWTGNTWYVRIDAMEPVDEPPPMTAPLAICLAALQCVTRP